MTFARELAIIGSKLRRRRYVDMIQKVKQKLMMVHPILASEIVWCLTFAMLQ
ncbi:polynucleotide kinase [Pseudomonas phage JHP]|nr:polynucleotide kinase [Pseudomonas phage JHP]